MTTQKTRLMPPRNFREIYWPRVCAFCNEYILSPAEGAWWCVRGEAEGDAGDLKQFHSTCDRWRKQE